MQNIDDGFVVGERYLFFENKKKKWERFFTSIDFDDGILTLYKGEDKVDEVRRINLKNCDFYDACKFKQHPCCVKILPSGEKKGIYLYGEDLRNVDEFKSELEELGGSFEGMDHGVQKRMVCASIPVSNSGSFSGEYESVGEVKRTRIEIVAVERWTKRDVQQWLKEVQMDKECGKLFLDNDIDGNILTELDENLLQNIGLEESVSNDLMIEVRRIHKNRTFSRNRFVVKSKFEKFPGYRQHEGDYQEMIDSLCDVTQLKHRYLSLADLKSHTLIKLTKEEYEEMGETQPETLQQYQEARIRVKIVVTEILHSSRSRHLRSVASPLVSALIPQLSQDFGFFHTAIIVGPWYLEWTDSELIIPKRMVSGRALICADVDSIQIPKERLPEISEKIAQVVVKWNTKMRYKNARLGGFKEQEGNCQDFVDDIFKVLDITPQFTGALENFIKGMRENGRYNLLFTPSKEFRKEFEIEERSWSFKTHLELDNFCCRIQKKCLEIYNEYPSEWSLLKSFDRAFWLRHLKDPDDPRYIPKESEVRSMKPFDTGCPFLDPRESLSMC